MNNIPHSIVFGGLLKKIVGIRRTLKQIKPDVLVTMGVPGALFDVPACVGLAIKHIISEKFDVEEKDVILNSIEEITNKGKRESVISAKVIDKDSNYE